VSGTSSPPLSVAALFAERDAKRKREQEAEEQLKRKQREELAAFKQRLDNFELTEERRQVVLDRIRRAFDRGDTELMLTSFPSSFCTDQGRAIANADAPPINRPKETAGPKEDREPEWLATLPRGARVVYDAWKKDLKPGGFAFTARIISYPGGKPGDVGLFFSWPKSAMDVKS
jgi:hypothetical protein